MLRFVEVGTIHDAMLDEVRQHHLQNEVEQDGNGLERMLVVLVDEFVIVWRVHSEVLPHRHAKPARRGVEHAECEERAASGRHQ